MTKQGAPIFYQKVNWWKLAKTGTNIKQRNDPKAQKGTQKRPTSPKKLGHSSADAPIYWNINEQIFARKKVKMMRNGNWIWEPLTTLRVVLVAEINKSGFPMLFLKCRIKRDRIFVGETTKNFFRSFSIFTTMNRIYSIFDWVKINLQPALIRTGHMTAREILLHLVGQHK